METGQKEMGDRLERVHLCALWRKEKMQRYLHTRPFFYLVEDIHKLNLM